MLAMTETINEVKISNRHTPFLLPDWGRQQYDYKISPCVMQGILLK